MTTLLFLGDIVGSAGRSAVRKALPRLKEQWAPDIVIANGENSAGGIGIDAKCAEDIFGAGVDIITTGNHVWSKKDAVQYLESNRHRLLRPRNYAQGAPGGGAAVATTSSGLKVGVLNLIGRVFMNDLVDCPFRSADDALSADLKQCDLIFVDFHAEATSEKIALGYYLDGRVTAVVGTHTHVQTADRRILPNGTAYLSDAGMCGPENGVLGLDHTLVVERFLSGRPTKFELAEGRTIINGVVVRVDADSRRAQELVPVYERLEG